MTEGAILHAGCVARLAAGTWAGVLLTGPSGAGKSDLALRLVERGWRLVADDRARVWASEGALYARAPETLAGLLEARQVGVVGLPRRLLARVALLVACEPAAAPLERVPEADSDSIVGVVLPRVALHPLDASAPRKVELALASLGRRFDSGAGGPI
ncbi:MAG: serine kinase [Pseudomonadota bacterium]|nr:serine kinase [Pseudomonadota bacterium]